MFFSSCRQKMECTNERTWASSIQDRPAVHWHSPVHHPAVLSANHRPFLLRLHNATDTGSPIQGTDKLYHQMHQPCAHVCPVQGFVQAWFSSRWVLCTGSVFLSMKLLSFCSAVKNGACSFTRAVSVPSACGLELSHPQQPKRCEWGRGQRQAVKIATSQSLSPGVLPHAILGHC